MSTNKKKSFGALSIALGGHSKNDLRLPILMDLDNSEMLEIEVISNIFYGFLGTVVLL